MFLESLVLLLQSPKSTFANRSQSVGSKSISIKGHYTSKADQWQNSHIFGVLIFRLCEEELIEGHWAFIALIGQTIKMVINLETLTETWAVNGNTTMSIVTKLWVVTWRLLIVKDIFSFLLSVKFQSRSWNVLIFFEAGGLAAARLAQTVFGPQCRTSPNMYSCEFPQQILVNIYSFWHLSWK